MDTTTNNTQGEQPTMSSDDTSGLLQRAPGTPIINIILRLDPAAVRAFNPQPDPPMPGPELRRTADVAGFMNNNIDITGEPAGSAGSTGGGGGGISSIPVFDEVVIGLRSGVGYFGSLLEGVTRRR